MGGIYCYRSPRGVVIIGRHTRQSLYSTDDTILATPHLTSAVRDGSSLHRFSARLESIIATYQSCEHSGTHEKGTYLTIADRRQTLKLPQTYETLEDATIALYRLSDDSEPSQFGFIDKHGARTLFPSTQRFVATPPHYQSRGVLDQGKQKAYAEFYAILVKNLELAHALQDEKDNSGSSLLDIRTYARAFDLEKAKCAIADCISQSIDYYHGPLQRFFIKLYLESEKPKASHPPIRRGTVPSLQEKLDLEYLPKHTKSMIVTMQSSIVRVAEYADRLEHELGLMVRPFRSIPALSIRGSRKDVERVYTTLERGQYSKFASALMHSTDHIMYSHGVYVPELIGKSTRKPTLHRIFTLWNLQNIGADAAQEYTLGKGASVGIIDTGVDYNHPDLRDRFGSVKGYDFVNNTDDPMDRDRHGTHVAGTIAGLTTGVAPGCTLYALRVLDENGAGRLDDILLGVDWCITHKVDVANLSLGSATGSNIEERMFQKAYQSGLISVAAAGNEGYGPSYPASYDSVISVAAVDRSNAHADFSNIYYTNNVSAPGVNIYSTLPGGGHGHLSGTSMATPHATGVAALVRSVQPADARTFQDIIEKTATPLGSGNEKENWEKYGCGLIQADKAVRSQGLLSWLMNRI
jgi:subtilisin